MGRKYIKSVILYGVLGLMCLFVNPAKMWGFALLFFGLAAFYCWIANKHWEDEPTHLDKIKSQVGKGIFSDISARIERRNQYRQLLSDLDDEFDTSDLDEYDEDDEYDEER